MKNKTIVSIDLWRTLIKSSPSFKEKKRDLIKGYLSWDLSNEIIDNAFKETKKSIDYIIERTGYQPNKDILWRLFLGNLNYHDNWDNIEDVIEVLSADYYALGRMCIPELYSNETFEVLEKLSGHYQLVLSSNTLFLSSSILLHYLKKLNIDHFFNNFYFSDKIGCSKPNPKMYGNSKYHIGDNILTDYKGAIDCGIDAFLINSNDKTIKDAYEYINFKENKNGIASVFCS